MSASIVFFLVYKSDCTMCTYFLLDTLYSSYKQHCRNDQCSAHRVISCHVSASEGENRTNHVNLDNALLSPKQYNTVTCIVNLGCNTGIRELCSTFDCIATFARYNYVSDVTKQETYATQPHPQLQPQPQPHPQLQPQPQPHNALARISNRATNLHSLFLL